MLVMQINILLQVQSIMKTSCKRYLLVEHGLSRCICTCKKYMPDGHIGYQISVPLASTHQYHLNNANTLQ